MEAAAYEQGITRTNLKPPLPWRQLPSGSFANLDVQSQLVYIKYNDIQYISLKLMAGQSGRTSILLDLHLEISVEILSFNRIMPVD